MYAWLYNHLNTRISGRYARTFNTYGPTLNRSSSNVDIKEFLKFT